MYQAEDYIQLIPARDVDGLIINNRWRIGEDVRVTKDGEPVFTVPADFSTDLASVPRMFWLITGGKTGAHQRAAVCHDYQCFVREISSNEAAQMFLDIMNQDGVSYWRAKMMYWAVRYGGPNFDAKSNRK
jgi:hypothetical protein